MNAWIIDVDSMPDTGSPRRTNTNAVGVRGPWGYKGTGDELTAQFRLYCDNDLMYEGRSFYADFHPLDDFGTPNAGCNRIDFLIGGKWQML